MDASSTSETKEGLVIMVSRLELTEAKYMVRPKKAKLEISS